MPRSRVLSFMSQWGGSTDSHQAGSAATSRMPRRLTIDTSAPPSATQALSQSARDSPSPTAEQRFRSDSRTSRPISMIQSYQPPLMDVAQDTLPELQPIFTFLNSHSNKLYQEGYFLKLHDLDSRGRPSGDRVWNECFAQLVGTVLSLWDAAALDAAGEDGEVVPSFVNLSDASIKMIESLPMNGSAGDSLQNVLSISTAANNRYLLHFNSLNSLTQWTAGIRLAMYEHATLQEAYTGSLIAGKGKMLNNIRTIMERSRYKTEDWARVRFGAGTPWRRCWCVISPPDEKEYQKAQKTLRKRDTYERKPHTPKGYVKFYDTRKVTKRTQPIATISNAYAAYAIYPQSKPLIEQSTLVKIEGAITIHGSRETTTEGFVFVMPEVHPAVTGFEMMLRFLFPVFDTFGLYGRPSRLIAETLDQRGLMFALPRDRRYGYLDILDVSALIHTQGSQTWGERQWRAELKKLTSHRMNSGDVRGLPRRNTLTSRTSLSLNRGAVRFQEDGSTHSTPATRRGSPAPPNESVQFAPPRRVDSAPLGAGSPVRGHHRSASDAVGYKRYQTETPSRLSYEATNADVFYDYPPKPPPHASHLISKRSTNTLERVVSAEEEPDDTTPAFEELKVRSASLLPAPVASPPRFAHSPGAKPPKQPYQAADLRKANSSIDAATLHQLADATGKPQSQNIREEERPLNDSREVATSVTNSSLSMPADIFVCNEGLVNRVAQTTGPMAHSPTEAYSLPTTNDSEKPPRHNIQASPVPTHKPMAGHDGASEAYDTTALPRPHHSITRKAVPHSLAPSTPNLNDNDSPSPSINGSLRDYLIDQTILERILQEAPASPVYSVDEGSVDYASIRAPSPKRPVERVRAGRLKTVGNPDVQPDTLSRFNPVKSTQVEAVGETVPSVDFGPTLTYRPRPNMSGHETNGDNNASQPRMPIMDNRRQSYAEGTKTLDDEVGQSRRRSVAWQPAGNTASPIETSARNILTPEQWVQHRASVASQPVLPPRPATMYMHSRHESSINLGRSTSKTPPLVRASSGDWSQRIRQMSKTPPLTRAASGDWNHVFQQTSKTPPLTRAPSGDWAQAGGVLGRPQSRTAGAYLNSPSSSKVLESTQPTHLSAREQMHIARATGTPMINLTSKDRKQTMPEQAPGLVGAMAVREREKAAIKNGMRSGMVQQAILSRQQQQQQQQAQAEMEAQMQAQYQAQQFAQQQAQAYQFQQQQQVYQRAASMPHQAGVAYSSVGYPGMDQYYAPQQQAGWSNMSVVNGGQGWGGYPQQQVYGSLHYQGDGQRQQQQQQQQQQQRRH